MPTGFQAKDTIQLSTQSALRPGPAQPALAEIAHVPRRPARSASIVRKCCGLSARVLTMASSSWFGRRRLGDGGFPGSVCAQRSAPLPKHPLCLSLPTQWRRWTAPPCSSPPRLLVRPTSVLPEAAPGPWGWLKQLDKMETFSDPPRGPGGENAPSLRKVLLGSTALDPGPQPSCGHVSTLSQTRGFWLTHCLPPQHPPYLLPLQFSLVESGATHTGPGLSRTCHL